MRLENRMKIFLNIIIFVNGSDSLGSNFFEKSNI